MHVLLSGATGYLGKHLLARCLRDGRRVTALVRSGERARLLRALAPFALPARLTDAARLQVVGVDLARPVNGDVVALLARHRPEVFVHAAGLTRFEAHLADELATHNLGGTQHAYDLARALGIPAFHHLSTAYVAGTARGPFGAADLELGQRFHNPYEETKFAAERWLRATAPGSGTALIVHRPSIVVGGHAVGATHAVSTLYAFLQALRFLRECCCRDEARGRRAFARLGVRRSGEAFHVPVRVAADPAATVNLVAIEDVVGSIVDACAGPPVASTFALTGQDYPIGALERAITATMGISGVSLVPAAAFESAPRTALETHFHRLTQVYAPYLFGSPCFAPRPAARRVDIAALTRDYLAQVDGPCPRCAVREPALGALALTALGIRAPRDYFTALCEGAVGRHFLARHDYVDATIGFRLHGESPCDVTLRIGGGRAAFAADAGAPVACRYELDAGLFMRIVRGAADLRASFLAGQVRITGDVELALKFGALLGLYYGRLDDHLLAELSA
ncbi:MAG TPA: SDR family oxidoreductase [Gammaproteobacteria bacterium]|nr:SDR family oxidoreductase [Gammaproteobacteria bacterium]